MNVHMNLLRWPDDFRAVLRNDGWVILGGRKEEEVEATHPQVKDEGAARVRLNRLGLLTSGSVRIEFRPQRRRKQQAATEREGQ